MIRSTQRQPADGLRLDGGEFSQFGTQIENYLAHPGNTRPANSRSAASSIGLAGDN